MEPLPNLIDSTIKLYQEICLKMSSLHGIIKVIKTIERKKWDRFKCMYGSLNVRLISQMCVT